MYIIEHHGGIQGKHLFGNGYVSCYGESFGKNFGGCFAIMIKRYVPKHLLDLTLNVIDILCSPPSEELSETHGVYDVAHQNDIDVKKAAAEQLEDMIQEADKTEPKEAFEQPEPPATNQPAEPKPKRRRKAKAPKLSPEDNAALQEELKKHLAEPGDVELELKPMKPNRPAAPGQLPGQIGLNEITGDDS